MASQTVRAQNVAQVISLRASPKRAAPEIAPPIHGPRLLDRVRSLLRARHYSVRTEIAYVGWIRRFILFHGKRHPRDMGEAEVTAFLTSLAVERSVASSTQNQALAALLFLYQHVLDQRLAWMEDVVRANRHNTFRSC